MNVTVCGYMVRHPAAGLLLAYFHYVLGLHRLGHRVCYLEESGWPYSCYDPSSKAYSENPEAGMNRLRLLFAEHGLTIPVYYVDRSDRKVFSTVSEAGWNEVKQVLSDTDLLINLGGVCELPEFDLCRRRVLVDMDPFFTQIGAFGFKDALRDYDRHFSYGVNIGRPGCTIPASGIDWYPTVPPVVTEMWQEQVHRIASPDTLQEVEGSFSTIANWSAYGSVSYSGTTYGQKNEEFLRLIELPAKTSQSFVLALSGVDSEIRGRMKRCGWHILDGDELSVNQMQYQAFVTGSRGEFSVAKNAYVKTRSGWFSDRSVCYLAAGRPVVLQDTGFTDWLPAQPGVMAFSSMDEALHCIDEVNANYREHSLAAIQVARNTFDYKIVLPRLLELACG